jgi:hypothetical protein
VQNVHDAGDLRELYRSFAANESNFCGALLENCFQPITQLVSCNQILIEAQLTTHHSPAPAQRSHRPDRNRFSAARA